MQFNDRGRDRLSCNDCNNIPYIAHEAALFRKEKTIKRLIIALIASQVICNSAWIVVLLAQRG